MNCFFIYHMPVFSCCSMVAGLKKDSLFKILLIILLHMLQVRGKMPSTLISYNIKTTDSCSE